MGERGPLSVAGATGLAWGKHQARSIMRVLFWVGRSLGEWVGVGLKSGAT
jgi:hypothetical protein